MGRLTDLLKQNKQPDKVANLLSARNVKSGQFRQNQILPESDKFFNQAREEQKLKEEQEFDMKNPLGTAEDRATGFTKFLKGLGDPFRNKTVAEQIIDPITLASRSLEAVTGAKSSVTDATTGVAASGLKAIPLVGDVAVPDKEFAELREKTPTLGTLPEKIPFVGGKEVKLADVTGLAANLGFTVAQYSSINKIIDGLGATSKLGAALGGSKLATFGAKQGADLLADIIVQTPAEVIRAINNDDSLGAFAKNTLINRGIDIVINGIVGGTIELATLKKLANLEPRALELALKKIDPEQAKSIRESLKTNVEVPLGPGIKNVDAIKAEPTPVPFIDNQRVGPLTDSTKTLENAQADFKDWRSKNFGGATGNVSDADMGVLKQLYKEDTGIDLDSIIKEFGDTTDAVKTDLPPLTKLLRDNPLEQAKKIDKVQETIKTQGKLTELEDTLPAKLEDIGSPRISDVKEPVVGKSKSPFADRVRNLISDDPTVSQLKRDLKELELTTTSNEARTAAAKEIVNQDLEAALKIVNEGDRFGSTVESEMGNAVVDALNKTGRNAEAVEVIAKMSEKFRSGGKDIQAASIWNKTTPSGMQKWAVDTLNNAEIKVDPNLIKEVGDDIRRIQDMSIDELAKLVADKANVKSDAGLNSLKNSYNLDQLKAVNTAITMNKVVTKIPVLQARKLSSIQAMSHLLNFKTFNRNILGNGASLIGEALSKYPASIADRGLSMVTGNRSVVANTPAFKKSLLEGWAQGKRSFFEIKAGVGKGKTGKYEALFGNTFKTKIGKNAEKLMSWSLQTPDEFFKGFSKADSLYNQVSARLGTQVKKMSFEDIMKKATSEEIDTAVKEAEFATFQNDSMLAEVFSKGKKGLNSLSTKVASVLPEFTGANKLFTEEFGLGDMVIKYTRVPGNIMTRGFEYSPLGYIKAGEGIFNMMKNLDSLTPQMQRELALKIGRATTGTGLLFLGKKLNELGIITDVDTSTDYDAKAFERAEGLGDYKINLTALSRYIKGGDSTRQEGDTLKTFNWAAPMVTPIGVGARMADKKITDPSFIKDLTTSTIEESMDIPSLFVAKQMMYEGMKEGSEIQDIVSVPLKEAIPGFGFSIARQTAQLLDPVMRDTSGGANAPFLEKLNPILGESTTGKIQANLPLLSKLLPEKKDVLGRTQERNKGIFANLIDPSTTTKFTPTAFGDKLRTIEDITGISTFFPDRKPPKTVSFNGENLSLTPEEVQQWQETEGSYIDELYTELLKEVDIDKSNAEVFAKNLSRMKSLAAKLAKSEFLENRFGGE